jgi:hypothetical protein
MLSSLSGTGERVAGGGCGAEADNGKGKPPDEGSVEVLRGGAELPRAAVVLV